MKPIMVRKWQRIYDLRPAIGGFVRQEVVGYVSPDLRCLFSGGMIVRKP